MRLQRFQDRGPSETGESASAAVWSTSRARCRILDGRLHDLECCAVPTTRTRVIARITAQRPLARANHGTRPRACAPALRR